MSESNPSVTAESSSDSSITGAFSGESFPKTTAGSAPTMVIVLAGVAVLLVVLLVILNLKTHSLSGSVPGSTNLATLEAQAAALKSQLNQQRMSLGLQPIADGSEPIEVIATRLKKDVETMVGVGNSFQMILAEKDAALSVQSGKLLQSEQVRQALAQELTRLKVELQQALATGSSQNQVLTELDEVKKQRDSLQLELATVKGQQVQSGDIAELQRRLEETMRAKDFFETKVKQLEESQAKTKP